MPGIPPYDAADEAAAREALGQLQPRPFEPLFERAVREVAGAVAQARREGGEEALRPLRALLAGPPTRSTYRLGPEAFSNTKIPCVEVPLAELEALLEETPELG